MNIIGIRNSEKGLKTDHYAALIPAVLAFLVYANSLGNGFVWDDTNVIVNNPALQGSPASLFRGIDTTRDYELLPYYRPLTALTFLLEGRLYGLTPFPMHLVNVLLHMFNAFLVFLLARTVTSETRAAFLAGLLFAVHPVNTEAVDFLSGGRNTMLACFFILTAYLLYHKSIIRNSIPLALTAAVFLLFGFFSKETALAVLPFIAALEVPSLRGQVSGSRARAVLRLLPSIVVLALYVILRWMTLSKLGIQSSIIPGFGSDQLTSFYKIPGFTSRLVDNLYIMPRYLLTVAWPSSLSPRYVIPDHLRPLTVPLLSGWICISAIIGWLFIKGRSAATLFGLFWFVTFYLPVSGIIMFPSAPMADRYFYIPAIGIWLVVAHQVSRFVSSGGRTHRLILVAAILVFSVLSILTIGRNFDWRNDVTLFSRCVVQHPDNAYCHAGLGEAYLTRNRQDYEHLSLAEREYEKALSLNPILPGVHAKMGYIKLARGESEKAAGYYATALGIYPLDKEALLNRGIALENLGRQKEALENFRRFLSIPGYELEDARPYAEARVRELSRLLH